MSDNPVKKDLMNACYECKFRGRVPGDAHSCCRHPNWSDIGVTGDPHGIKSGWFWFPINFDPAWLKTCEGFTKK